MSNLNKFYLSAVLTCAGIGIFFLGKHYSFFFVNEPIITDAVEPLEPKASGSSINEEIVSGVKALASLPEEFSLEKHIHRQAKVQGKLMISLNASSVTFPQSEGDPYRWSPLDGYLIEGTVDSIARYPDSK